MMNRTLHRVFWLGVTAALFSGCTLPSSRRLVPSGQANVLQHADLGTVTSVRAVNIEGRKGQIGLFGGGLVGSAAASGGSGVSGALVKAAGTVVGAVGGQASEEALTRQRAQEITIRLDDGRTVSITQESATGLFMDGDRVRVINGGGSARVVLATN